MSDGIRCAWMRGGTSKGAFFVRDDLPTAPDARDALLLRIMGTPDPRQVDGIGGAHPLTSKVAVVAPAADLGVDVDYLFLQVGVDRPVVSDTQTCGNLLAAVGPFAVERGVVSGDGTEATVRIRMVNTGAIAEARFAVHGGRPVYAGDARVPGVPGTAAPIHIDYEGLAGANCGALLPTGSAVDTFDGVSVTCVDYGMPVIVLRASDVGRRGDEPCEELEADGPLRARLERLRCLAGLAMGLGDVGDLTVPKVTLVGPPVDGGAVSTRTFIPHRCHQAIGVLGGLSVAVACQLPGTPAAQVTRPAERSVLELEHPTGIYPARLELAEDDGGRPVVVRAGTTWTARLLMDGIVHPRPE
jgi:4-oxalomesaconate tautomerase